MSAAAGAASAGAVAAQQAIANAIKASGAIVRIEPVVFMDLLARVEEPLVIECFQRVLFSNSHTYLMSYRGFVFYAKSSIPLSIPDWCEVIRASKVWTPQ